METKNGLEIDLLPVERGDHSGDCIAMRYGDLYAGGDKQTVVVIMVKHDHIKQNWDKLKGKVILDCHNICPLEGVYHI